LEPVHEAPVIGQPSQQRHCCVRVQIDEARDQHVACELGSAGAGKALARLARRQDLADTAVFDDYRVLVKNDSRRHDRNDPVCLDDGEFRIGQGVSPPEKKSPAEAGLLN
jgi:hypothetical protein